MKIKNKKKKKKIDLISYQILKTKKKMYKKKNQKKNQTI